MMPPAPIVYITSALLEQTAHLLSSFAEVKESEGITYWLGLEFGMKSVVTTLVVPDADTSDGSVSTSAAANAEALTVAVNTPLVLLGQAHSHPSELVDHSWIDDRDTFAQFPGALSVVVPFYGRGGMDLSTCGVHRFIDGTYCRIRSSQVPEHIRVLPTFADFRAVVRHV
jgi:hypothetical protein